MKDTFIQQVDGFVDKHQLLHTEMKIVVAVSGGPDSLALLYYLLTRQKEDRLSLIVAHVDHMFRGAESYEDLLYVQRLCEELRLPFEGRRIDVSSYQREHGLSAQVAARECRYVFLQEVMEQYKANAVALGHHGDDQVETVLMRLVRGSNSYGGIATKRSFGTGYIIRPLLGVTKEQVEQYCRRLELQPRIDPSNSKATYTRNRFRHHILPLLKAENPLVHERFQAFSKFIQEDESYLQELAAEKMNKVIRKEAENEIVLSIPDFESLPIPLQRRGIQLILNYLYKHKLPSSLSSIHIEQALSFLKRSHPSGSLDFPEGLKVVRAYEECHFGFLEERASSFSYMLPVPGRIVLPNGDEVIAELSKEFPSVTNDALCVVPSSTISLPLVVRSRLQGDRMRIMGMNGTKKIKAIFIEEKVPRQKRGEWPIVCDAQGTILWLPLLRKSPAAASCSKEESYIRIQYKSNESSRRINR